MNRLDPRIHAVRPELADLALQGQVEASRFVEGEVMQVTAAQAPVRRAPSDSAMLLTEALYGEEVRVFETTRDGWAWVQLAEDRYVGWTRCATLGQAGAKPRQRVSALRTFIFAEPDIKSPPLAALPMGARVSVVGHAEDRNAKYALLAPAGSVVVQHLAPLGATERDWTSVAERFMGTPYLWGGKTSAGLDCSGLVQVAFAACGIGVPRDSDMQESVIGQELTRNPTAENLPGLQRGDLVFWKGHVGIMRDSETLLHANAFHMEVAAEPLRLALARLPPVTSVRRHEAT